jgi:hypothetical protein
VVNEQAAQARAQAQAQAQANQQMAAGGQTPQGAVSVVKDRGVMKLTFLQQFNRSPSMQNVQAQPRGSPAA